MRDCASFLTHLAGDAQRQRRHASQLGLFLARVRMRHLAGMAPHHSCQDTGTQVLQFLCCDLGVSRPTTRAKKHVRLTAKTPPCCGCSNGRRVGVVNHVNVLPSPIKACLPLDNNPFHVAVLGSVRASLPLGWSSSSQVASSVLTLLRGMFSGSAKARFRSGILPL